MPIILIEDIDRINSFNFSILEIGLIFIFHWIADFIFQSETMANNKSWSISWLLKHTITYSLIISTLLLGFLTIVHINDLVFPHNLISGVSKFFISTFIFHTLTDYCTSKIVKYKFQANEYGSPIPNFGAFTVIGLDQVFHYLQLYLSYGIFIILAGL